MVEVEKSNHSLAEAVREEINSMPHIKTSLSDGVLNYSALARKISPYLSEKFGKKINEESIIVSIKRYADEMEESSNKFTYYEMFADSEITLQDNMCYTHFKRNDRVTSNIDKLYAEGDWKLGEMRVLIQGADQVMVIMKEKRVNQLLEELSEDVMFSIPNSALLTFRMPYESFKVYGMIAELTSTLAKKGISIELLTSPPDIHFLIDDADAERAYKTLKQLIKDSKQKLAEKKSISK